MSFSRSKPPRCFGSREVQEFATQVSWQKVDEKTGAAIEEEDITDSGTIPGGGGDTPGDGSDDLEG